MNKETIWEGSEIDWKGYVKHKDKERIKIKEDKEINEERME